MIENIRDVIDGADPVFLLVAGPNGAGKTTYVKKRLASLGLTCINPDDVATRMFGPGPHSEDQSKTATIAATQLVLGSLSRKQSVGLESVFSDTKGHKLGLLDDAKAAGFRIVIVFIGLNSPQLSIARVMQRVEAGGHDVPDDRIRERFPRSYANLRSALAKVDLVLLVDNSGLPEADAPPSAALRHNEFALVRDGRLVSLSGPVPAWFTLYGIEAALS